MIIFESYYKGRLFSASHWGAMDLRIVASVREPWECSRMYQSERQPEMHARCGKGLCLIESGLTLEVIHGTPTSGAWARRQWLAAELPKAIEAGKAARARGEISRRAYGELRYLCRAELRAIARQGDS